MSSCNGRGGLGFDSTSGRRGWNVSSCPRGHPIIEVVGVVHCAAEGTEVRVIVDADDQRVVVHGSPLLADDDLQARLHKRFLREAAVMLRITSKSVPAPTSVIDKM